MNRYHTLRKNWPPNFIITKSGLIKRRYFSIPLIALMAVAVACSSKKAVPDNDFIPQEITSVPNPDVKIELVKKTDFQKQLMSNGKLSAFKQAELSFRLDFKIAKIFKRNGDRVKKGDLLASLEDQELIMRFAQSKMQFERAQLDLADALIGLGYDISDSLNIPQEVLSIAKLRSGYAQAKSDYEIAAHDYRQRHLYAPIPGVMANMFSKEMNFPLPDGPFCTIIDNRQFQIDFPIMESELFLVKPGMEVKVQPYHDEQLTATGHINYINPVVDENGLVTVSATISNKKGRLYEGMNVKVFVEQKVKDILAVPKHAVTRRSGKDVIFTYKEGMAQWNYVEISGENDEMVIVSEGLNDGDTVIVDGNIHLAHLSKVEVKNNESFSYN